MPGPKGDPGKSIIGLSAFGGLYHDIENTISLEGDVYKRLSFSKELASYGIGLPDKEQIRISKNGMYELSYFLVFHINTPASMITAPSINGGFIPSAIICRRISTEDSVMIQASTIQQLTADDLISLSVKASISVTITLEEGCNASLYLKKIDND